MSRLVVVKLGGSFYGSRHLEGWLAALTAAAGLVVVVPGGGPFADSVRQAQKDMALSDRAAHVMALLAMEQLAHAYADLAPAFEPASSISVIEDLVAAGAIPIWCPTAMVLAAEDIAATWDLTSDSLSAWLAGRLGARRLIVVKQVRPKEDTSSEELSSREVVDKAFPRMLARAGVDAWIAGPGAPPDLAGLLGPGAPAASCVRISAPAAVDA